MINSLYISTILKSLLYVFNKAISAAIKAFEYWTPDHLETDEAWLNISFTSVLDAAKSIYLPLPEYDVTSKFLFTDAVAIVVS